MYCYDRKTINRLLDTEMFHMCNLDKKTIGISSGVESVVFFPVTGLFSS